MGAFSGADDTVTDGLIFCIDTMNSKCLNVTSSVLFDMGSANLDMVNDDPTLTVNRDGTIEGFGGSHTCLLYTSPSPRDRTRSRMPSSA